MNDGLIARAGVGAAVAEAELARVPGWIWNATELPVPIERIAEDFYGFLVEEKELSGTETDRYVSGLLVPELRRILVDRLESARAPGRRRFTVAHELGHWVIHHRSSIRLSTSSLTRAEPREDDAATLPPELGWMAQYPAGELDANQFAGAMLMPERLLNPARAQMSDIDSLARLFLVSPYALERRLAFLDVLAVAPDRASFPVISDQPH